MVLEGAHEHGSSRFDGLRSGYLESRRGTHSTGNGADNGWYSDDAAKVLQQCGGGRWLTADFQAGDAVRAAAAARGCHQILLPASARAGCTWFSMAPSSCILAVLRNLMFLGFCGRSFYRSGHCIAQR